MDHSSKGYLQRQETARLRLLLGEYLRAAASPNARMVAAQIAQNLISRGEELPAQAYHLLNEIEKLNEPD